MRLPPRLPTVIQIAVQIPEEGLVPLPLHGIQPRAHHQRLRVRGVLEGVVLARQNGDRLPGADGLVRALERGAHDAGMDQKGLGLA